MELIQVDYPSKSSENLALGFAVIGGFLIFFLGLVLVIAPGDSFFFIQISSDQEPMGLAFIIIGMFSLQEARNQKRYITLRCLLK